MSQEQNILIQKLEFFIKKYYKNQLLKGAILAVSISLIAFFAVSVLEFFGRFNTGTRTFLFSLYILGSAAILFWYVIRPIGGLINIRRNLSYRKASLLIGQYFPEVKDKLLNTLELQESALNTKNSLLLASIEQKTAQLSPIPFSNAIKFNSNLRYVKLALIPAVILLLIMVISPGFKSSSERIVKFNQHFEPEAPFSFVVDASIFNTVQNRDLKIPLKLEGSEIPKDAYIHIGELRYKMSRKNSGQFEYLLRNVQKGQEIWFESGGFNSDRYTLDVALKPSLLSYNAKLDFPAYLDMEDQTVSNIGEITVPEGTGITWNFETRHVDQIEILPEGKEITNAGDRASFSKIFKKSSLLQVKTKNRSVKDGDSLFYNINVIPDAYPKIDVDQKSDSLSAKILYFLGEVNDDHGFTKLSFSYKFVNAQGDKKGKSGTVNIALDKKIQKQTFYHYWDLKQINVQAEDEIEYYFTVWDNDGVNGAKATRSQISTYKAPSLKEIKEQTEKSNENIKSSLSSSQAKASEIEKDLQEVKKMLTEKKNLDWNDKKKIEDLLKKHEQLQKEIEETVNENMEKNMKEEEFKDVNEEMLEKQQKIEELFEKVMDEETKELMEKIRKLMEENRMQELQQEMENLEFSEEEMSKDLDRMLELFKELELEKKLNETVEKLNELSKKQQELSEKTKNGEKKDEELIKEQEKLNEEFEELKKDLEDIEEKNKALEQPKSLDMPKEDSDQIQEKMNQSKESMEKGKNSDASEKQQDAAEEMKKMAESLEKQIEEAYEEQYQEDYNALRQILENLVQLSFDQEQIISEFKQNRSYNARYIELRQLQRRIVDESKMVEDSLLALSKRNPEIEHFVNEEIARVNQNLDRTLAHLGERQTSEAMVNQQYVMTGYNNLALMLSQSLEAMQEQMKSMKEKQQQKSGQCKKPGSGQGEKPKKPNAQTIKKMQQDLAKQLQEMMDGKKKGQQPGSKEFAEMAAKQAEIRKRLQELERDLQKEGKGGSLGDLQKTQDMMDDIEKDLYYKKLDPAVMEKLQDIEIRLSEHENAEKKQDKEEKRAAEEAKEKEREIPPSIKKYLEEKMKEQEMLRSVSPELQPYYKQKVKNYFGS
ncbi:hypothetical protein GYB22_01085 [bacterium]|nr:hypothetical protein [bacterium]